VFSLTGAGKFATGAITNKATWITNGSGNDGTHFTGGGNNKLASGAAVEMTVSGQTVTVTAGAGGMTTTALATALQAAISGLGAAFHGIHVAFVTGGTTNTGFMTAAGAVGLATGNTNKVSGAGFAVFNTNGASMAVTLKVDQKTGFDVTYNAPTHAGAGTKAIAALDLATKSSAVALTVGPHPGATVESTTGASTVVAGSNASAVLQSANGVQLNMVSTNVTSTGGATLTLTSGAQALGYNGAAIEIKSSLATNGGLANFTLNQGAVFQVGANGGQTVGLTIQSTASLELGRNASATLTSLDDLSSSNASALTTGKTQEALKVIDAAINQVTNLRGQLGAFQADTLQSGLNSLKVSTQNLTSAEGTIRDVDFAAASAAFTKNQILVQSSTAMLAQANQLPQSVLKLLA